MIDAAALTSELKARVSGLVDDLRTRADEVPEVAELVHGDWLAASEAGRTAHDEDTWREDLLAQVAVSWVLGTVFIRFCEDNGLLADPLISGPGDWRRWASDAQLEFFREHPADGERAFLLHVFEQAAGLPGLGQVFGEHNPLWRFGPSDDVCRSLIELWRQVTDGGPLVWDFADPEWGTRFLGDLYQDLSDHAKKTYALLQTPDFVEEFILDRTLEPALDEFGLAGADAEVGFGLIDPACGSGHFLLGAFARLAKRHLDADPGAGPRAAAARALGNVYGVDLNPFAASIARFRLLVAALRFAEVAKLSQAPVFDIQVAVGDSLLHGPARTLAGARLPEVERSMADTAHLYATEDAALLDRILGRRYEAVVANPPYITVKDQAAGAAYRDRYPTCHRQYSLAVPFMERIFDLAYRGASDRPVGFTGQITANSFMEREFGKKLIEDFLASEVDLTHVIDTSGAYIPGHGTPTVILFGRNRGPVGDKLRAVLGVRGEPSSPAVPAEGKVWSSIERLIDQPGAEDDFVSVDQLGRERLAGHPWSLQGGAAGPLTKLIEGDLAPLQAAISPPIGGAVRVGADEAYLFDDVRLRHSGLARGQFRKFVVGRDLRDWSGAYVNWLWDPYSDNSTIESAELLLWRWRAILADRATFQGKMADAGLKWYEYMQYTARTYQTPHSLTFAFVSTHNHFVLDRGGNVFNKSAPVIKLPEGASEAEHLQLLGLLNSAVACFWMKQVFQGKPSNGVDRGLESEAWTVRSEFDGTKLKAFPIVTGEVLPWAEALDRTAQELSSALPTAAAEAGHWGNWSAFENEVGRLRGRMVWLQDELDWRCAFLYGITDRDLSFSPDQAFELEKGQRAFEIALARRAASGEMTTEWFRRHRSAPVTELPDGWPAWYRDSS